MRERIAWIDENSVVTNHPRPTRHAWFDALVMSSQNEVFILACRVTPIFARKQYSPHNVELASPDAGGWKRYRVCHLLSLQIGLGELEAQKSCRPLVS